MPKVQIRSAYDGDADAVSAKTALTCADVSLAKQSEAAACDVNLIVQRWLKSGGTMDLSQRVGDFLDVSDVPDYHSALNFVKSANSMFDALPATVRERFDNDPGQFVAFCSVPDNLPEMVTLGLAKAPAEPVGSPVSPLAGAAGASPSPSPDPVKGSSSPDPVKGS